MHCLSFRTKPLRSQILIIYVPLLIISILFVLLFIYSAGVQNQRQEAFYQMENRTDVLKILLEERMENILGTFASIENSDAFSGALLDLRFGNDDSYTHLINIDSMLDGVYEQYHSIIDSVYISLNGTEFTLMKRTYPRFSSPDITSLYESFGESGKYFWVPLHRDRIFTAENRDVFSVVRFYGSPEDSQLFGVMILNIRSDYIMNLLNNHPLSRNGYWALATDNDVFAVSDSGSFGLKAGAVDFLSRNMGERGRFESVSAGGQDLYVYFDSLSIGWGIAAVLPKGELVRAGFPIQFSSLLLVILVITVMSLFAIFFANRISGSLRELSKQVEAYDINGLPQLEFRESGSREVAKLSSALTRMSITIHRLIESILEKQQMLRRVELAALQEKIKPHFMYNSLSTVLYEIDSGENRKAGEMLRNLITFFRLSVNKGNEFSSVRDELRQVDSYLRIMQLRNSCSFAYVINAEEDLYSCRILRFMLQPIAENCIKHGFGSRNTDADNQIMISIYQDRQDIIFEVFDNGEGIHSEELAVLIKQIKGTFSEPTDSTYGLKNADLRIRLVYGEEYGLSIESEQGDECYTCVRIRIPMKAPDRYDSDCGAEE